MFLKFNSYAINTLYLQFYTLFYILFYIYKRI